MLPQSSQPCTVRDRFTSEDLRILDGPQIGDAIAFEGVLQHVFLSGYTPDIREKMIACAYDRHRGAVLAPGQSSVVPSSFTPTVNTIPVPMVPASVPRVQPIVNYAPSQMIQSGQVAMQAGRQMMAIADLMAAQVQEAQQVQAADAAKAVAKAKSESAALKDSPDDAIRLIGRGEDFVRVCSSMVQQADLSQPTLNNFSCAMYIEGILQGAAKYPGTVKLLWDKKVPQKMCVSPGAETSPVHLIGVVLDFIDRNPQMKDMRTADVAVMALMSQFPCR